MNSYSQIAQDKWVYSKLPKHNGTFVDIGCGHPQLLSNTLALEQMGWRGVLLDSTECDGIRRRLSRFIKADAKTVNWKDELRALPEVIDYLSLDVDEASCDALLNIMGSGHKFRVITIEHDAYRFGGEPRSKMRSVLKSYGYDLEQFDLCCTPGMPFEDWWIHPDHINDEPLPELNPKNGSSPINRFFDAVFCINLARRVDRWEHAMKQCATHNLNLERFEAIDAGAQGNHGCSQSHRAVMGLIVERKISKALILEDDFEFLYPDSQLMFSQMITMVPKDWDMLYLGGHYAEKPRKRINKNVILAGHLKTTSSYGVTLQMAERIYAHLPPNVGSPIDEMYRVFNQNDMCYIFQPRLLVQYSNYSDIQKMECGNCGPMMDTRHENMV